MRTYLTICTMLAVSLAAQDWQTATMPPYPPLKAKCVDRTSLPQSCVSLPHEESACGVASMRLRRVVGDGPNSALPVLRYNSRMGLIDFLFGNNSFVLHSMYEVGATAEKRYDAASKILNNALKDSGSSRHKQLHWALDVVLCEGKFDELPVDTPFHKRYWELGHRIASEIVKQQEILNIDSVWFASSYEEAKKLFRPHEGPRL